MLRSMRLYLVRHADAAPGEPDDLRPLTAHGRKQARELGSRLVHEAGPGAVVLTSPLLRARETADEIARSLGTQAVVDERLAPGMSVSSLLAATAERGEKVVAVGHQPDCGRVAGSLAGSEEPPFPKAGMVVIDLPE
jgi:phosphohistidine phosphatase SixA